MPPGILIRTLTFSALLCAPLVAEHARAQSFGQHLDFGVLETGVLPNGVELPDLTGDTLDLDSPPPPKRAEALPPPADFYDAPGAPAKKKSKKLQR